PPWTAVLTLSERTPPPKIAAAPTNVNGCANTAPQRSPPTSQTNPKAQLQRPVPDPPQKPTARAAIGTLPTTNREPIPRNTPLLVSAQQIAGTHATPSPPASPPTGGCRMYRIQFEEKK